MSNDAALFFLQKSIDNDFFSGSTSHQLSSDFHSSLLSWRMEHTIPNNKSLWKINSISILFIVLCAVMLCVWDGEKKREDICELRTVCHDSSAFSFVVKCFSSSPSMSFDLKAKEKCKNFSSFFLLLNFILCCCCSFFFGCSSLKEINFLF